MTTNEFRKKKVERLRLHVDAPPPSANRIWRNAHGRTYLTPDARSFFRAVAAAAWSKRIPNEWNACDVLIYVRPKRRAGDVDNFIKPTLDALTFAGVWKDDRVVSSVYCERLDPKEGSSGLWIEIVESVELYKKGAPW